ncbi:hypothetical protein RND71_005563 [Anisodus tanguticus]|uniref:Uncharacterized protein n=1 Tax=Anisodus tanguticus TaxID=243964 RepID=A0AAE1SUF6_9SOLA|nr:hypothetical protein RND71_005563 [Anisodus tanguticus]
MKNLILAKKIREKQNSALKQIKGAASVFGFAKHGKIKEERGILNPVSENHSLSERNELGVSTENPFWNTKNDSETKSILMVESLPNEPMKVKKQKKPFKGLFGVDDQHPAKQKKPFKGLFGVDDQHRAEPESEGKSSKSGKKLTWGFDGFKKWKKNDSEDETAPLSLNEKSDGGGTYLGQLVAEPVGGGGPDTKQIKRKFYPNGAPSDFFVDKVLGDSIKKELSRIQTEHGAKNSSVELTTWCDRYGDVVLDVVRKEFKNHVGEMGGNMKGITREEKQQNSKRWTTFDDYDYDDDENCHPNLFAPQRDHHHTFPSKQAKILTPLKSGPVALTSQNIILFLMFKSLLVGQ